MVHAKVVKMFQHAVLICMASMVVGVLSDELTSHNLYISGEITGLINSISYVDVLDDAETYNTIECSRKCAHSHSCLSFFYNENSKSCQLHGRGLEVAGVGAYISASGYRFYKMKGKGRFIGEACQHSAVCVDENSECGLGEICECTSEYGHHPGTKMCQQGLIGLACVTASQCLVNNSECRSGICGCQVGYSFNARTQTCVHGCATYGATFETFDNWYIQGYGLRILSNKTPAQCAQLCIDETDFTCISFETNTSNGCHLQNVSVLDVPPSSYKYSSLNAFHQRNCA